MSFGAANRQYYDPSRMDRRPPTRIHHLLAVLDESHKEDEPQ